MQELWVPWLLWQFCCWRLSWSWSARRSRQLEPEGPEWRLEPGVRDVLLFQWGENWWKSVRGCWWQWILWIVGKCAINLWSNWCVALPNLIIGSLLVIRYQKELVRNDGCHWNVSFSCYSTGGKEIEYTKFREELITKVIASAMLLRHKLLILFVSTTQGDISFPSSSSFNAVF